MGDLLNLFQDNWQQLTKMSGIFLGIGAILSFSLKRWVKEAQIKKFGNGVESVSYGFGVAITGGMSKWKITKPFWNNILEGYVILFMREFFSRIITGMIRGLESDNPSFKE